MVRQHADDSQPLLPMIFIWNLYKVVILSTKMKFSRTFSPLLNAFAYNPFSLKGEKLRGSIVFLDISLF